MQTFKHGDTLPVGALEYTPRTVQAVQMDEPFKMEYMPGFYLEGRAGDYLVKTQDGEFFAASPKALSRYYALTEETLIPA